MERSLREGGLLWRMLGAWADLRRAMRGELDRQPTEGRLLFYAMLSGLIWSVGELMLVRYSPASAALPEEEFLGNAAAILGGALFVRTLALYLAAAVAHAIARGLGGGGSWRDSRAAMFWAVLVAAPAMVAAALLALMLADTPRSAGAISDTLGSLAFAWVAAACIAEAHGFASTWRGLVVVVIMAAMVLAVIAVMALL
ncbi:MAG TPA: YIP1 family protein [Thermohalobaculum sp.]|nr:YIP1 family protein [Thermohalobaculum sp.]